VEVVRHYMQRQAGEKPDQVTVGKMNV